MNQLTFIPKTPADMVNEYAEVSQQVGSAGLYRDLIREEYAELAEEMYAMERAEGAEEPEHELKEMADLLYVLYGYAKVQVVRGHKHQPRGPAYGYLPNPRGC